MTNYKKIKAEYFIEVYKSPFDLCYSRILNIKYLDSVLKVNEKIDFTTIAIFKIKLK
jgi:hypothetical protein